MTPQRKERERADKAIDEIMAPPKGKAAPDVPPWDLRAYIRFLFIVGAALRWDYSRRDRWTRKLQCWNLKALNRLTEHLADVTGEKQLKFF